MKLESTYYILNLSKIAGNLAQQITVETKDKTMATWVRGVFSGGARGAMAPLMIWDLKEKN